MGTGGCGLLDGREGVVCAGGQVDDREVGAGQRPGERRSAGGADGIGARRLA
jgi:hypothetical protein